MMDFVSLSAPFGFLEFHNLMLILAARVPDIQRPRTRQILRRSYQRKDLSFASHISFLFK